jgi:hypothetical protein
MRRNQAAAIRHRVNDSNETRKATKTQTSRKAGSRFLPVVVRHRDAEEGVIRAAKPAGRGASIQFGYIRGALEHFLEEGAVEGSRVANASSSDDQVSTVWRISGQGSDVATLANLPPKPLKAQPPPDHALPLVEEPTRSAVASQTRSAVAVAKFRNRSEA